MVQIISCEWRDLSDMAEVQVQVVVALILNTVPTNEFWNRLLSKVKEAI